MMFSLLGKAGSLMSLPACQPISINKSHRGKKKNHTDLWILPKVNGPLQLAASHTFTTRLQNPFIKKNPSVLQVDIAAVVVKSFTFAYVCSVQMKALNHFVKGKLISFPIFEKIPISMSTLGRLWVVPTDKIYF